VNAEEAAKLVRELQGSSTVHTPFAFVVRSSILQLARLDAGADVRHIAEMLGHQKLETTMDYTRVSMAKLLEVHARCHPAEQVRRSDI
jgi:integrase/recombinase XerD